MSNSALHQVDSREKTLLTSLLLSAWGPLTTAIAVVLSSSTTQLADFVRRSVELVAMFVTWFVYRRLHRGEEFLPAEKASLERRAALTVAAALSLSALAMIYLFWQRSSSFQPGGNVYPGLVVAILGLLVNSWFWRRYAAMCAAEFCLIIDAQRRLYRAKSFVDFCVIMALAAVAWAPHRNITIYLDSGGALVVATYLLQSAFTTARRALRAPGHL